MTIGASIFLIAVGAILAFAVEFDDTSGIDLNAIGVILMLVGLLGALLSMFLWNSDTAFGRRRSTVVERDVVVDDDPVLLRRGRRVRRTLR